MVDTSGDGTKGKVDIEHMVEPALIIRAFTHYGAG